MSYSGGIISEPVSIRDIQRALGVSNPDLGTLCKHVNVNKWAMYKPEGKVSGSGISGNMPIDNLTLAQRKSNFFALTPQLNTKAKQVSYGYGGTDTKDVGDSGYTIQNIADANVEWPYTKPVGGMASPYRQTDFACDRAKTYGIQGYRHQARPPIFGWFDWEIFLSDVQSIVNANIVDTIYNTDISAFEWKVDNILYDNTFYNAISGRLSENSASRFGGGGDDMIPISWLLSGITSENWRIGIGVFVESETKMHLITSSYPLKYMTNVTTVMQQGPVFPALGTNQFLCKKMIAALGNASYKTFKAIPLLVRNCMQTVAQLDSSRQTLITFSGTNTLIYSVPSNSMTFNITLRNETKPDIQGMNTIADSNTTDGTFILATYGTGQYAGGSASASITPIIALGIFLTDSHSFTGTKTLVYDVDYSYGLNNQPRSYGHISGTINITNSNIISTSNGNRVGVTIAAAPALSVTDFVRLQYQS
ncbi:MAG: hypothetical protein IKK92_08075 [Prevotella sp.]|nr:hypothetical protein [Prevotella sp.]